MQGNNGQQKPAFVAFASRDFRVYQGARLLSLIGLQMQTVAIGWEVYNRTNDPLQLGYVGLAQFLPSVLFAPATGDVADRFDRRAVLGIASLLLASCAGLLLAFSTLSSTEVWGFYLASVLAGTARAFAGPAGHALMPNLLPVEQFSSAVAWSSSIFQIGVIAGPAVGGLAYGYAGSANAVYASTAVLQLWAAGLFFTIRVRSLLKPKEGEYWSRVLAGLRFVQREKVILGAISLDLFAVLFGGAVALLPVFARDILQVGPTGLGLLRSAPAMGAALTAVVMAYRPLERGAGKVMFACVGLFGLCMIAFGLSRNFAFSMVVLAVSGAADMVSVVVRHTLVQLNTPDEMRGRVSAVNVIFIGASNELGEFESGVMAAWLGSVAAVVSGGIATCAVVVIWASLFPSLWRFDRLNQLR